MTELQRRALARLPMTEAEVSEIYRRPKRDRTGEIENGRLRELVVLGTASTGGPLPMVLDGED